MTLQLKPGLHVIAGCMYSGKTDELIRKLHVFQLAGMPVHAFVHRLGVHSDGQHIKSRAGSIFEAQQVTTTREMRSSVLDSYLGTPKPDTALAVVGIDEAQFFDLADCEDIVSLSRWFYVLVSGLDTDFRGEPFPGMAYLMACATEVTKLYAVCAKCKSIFATRTQRLIDGRPAPYDSPLIMPGDKGLYEPRCILCHEI